MAHKINMNIFELAIANLINNRVTIPLIPIAIKVLAEFLVKLDTNSFGSSGFEGISRTNGNRKPVWAMITA